MFKLLEQVTKTGKLKLRSGDIEIELDNIQQITGDTEVGFNIHGIKYEIQISGIL